jgi:hypothetical protein
MRTADERGCDWDTVGEYLERLDNGAATKRIVYLADQLGIDLPAREELVASFTSGYSLLDPTRPDTGPTVRIASESTSIQPRWSRRSPELSTKSAYLLCSVENGAVQRRTMGLCHHRRRRDRARRTRGLPLASCQF